MVFSAKLLATLAGSLVLVSMPGCQGGANPTSVFTPANQVALGATGRIPRAGDAARYGGRHDRLAVLSFNMEHKDRPSELAVMADRLRSDLAETPDFVLLQEVIFNRSGSKGPEDNTAAVLAKLLGYHARGTKRTSDREGVAILSRYPFAFYDERHLKSQTSRFLLGFRRVSVMAEFLVPDLGRVRVVNVHLTNWGFEDRVRGNQLKETLEWLAAREEKVHADITILGGDFNSEPGSNELALIANPDVAGALRFDDWNRTDPTRGPEGKPNHRVDYIYVASDRHELKMLGEQRLWLDGLAYESTKSRFWLSDHVPVLHEYAVPRARGLTRPTLAKGAAPNRQRPQGSVEPTVRTLRGQRETWQPSNESLPVVEGVAPSAGRRFDERASKVLDAAGGVSPVTIPDGMGGRLHYDAESGRFKP